MCVKPVSGIPCQELLQETICFQAQEQNIIISLLFIYQIIFDTIELASIKGIHKDFTCPA